MLRSMGGVGLVIALAACGPSQAPANSTDDAPLDEGTPSDSKPTADAPDGEAPATSDEPAAGGEESGATQESDHEELARHLIKKPGRSIGYSAQKKSFAVTRETVSGGTFTVEVVFTDDAGKQTEVVRICDPSECDEQLDDLAKKKIPDLAKRFEEQGYVAVRAVGWPSGGELDVGSMGLKLVLKDRRLSAEREGKPAKPLGTLPAKAGTLLAVFPIPDAELIGVYSAPDDSGANREFVAFKTK